MTCRTREQGLLRKPARPPQMARRLDEAVTGHSQVFDGTPAMPLPSEASYGETEVLPALVGHHGALQKCPRATSTTSSVAPKWI